jgi:hypothetical protein
MNPRTLKVRMALAVCGLALLTIPRAAAAAGGHYTALECSPYNRTHDASQNADAGFDTTAYCADAGHDYAMQINSTGASPVNQGRSGYWSWNAPPNTAIVGVDIEAKLRNDNGFHSRLVMADGGGNQTAGIAQGDGTDAHWTAYSWSGSPQARFVAKLVCETNQCAPSDAAKTWVRGVSITLVDSADPVLTDVRGSLLGTGWMRGIQTLGSGSSDSGSGMLALAASVNGQQAAFAGGGCQSIPGTQVAAVLAPCPTDIHPSFDVSPDTRMPPFRDGQNSVAICASDFAGDQACRNDTILVDNTPPLLAFESVEDPRDPELISAPVSDSTSGIASGQISLRRAGGGDTWQAVQTELVGGVLSTRIDSESYPAGRYELLASATDVAGNGQTATTRQNGSPMVLDFPLKTATKLTARLHPGGGSKVRLPYGERPTVTGRLRDATGRPLAHRTVQVVEHYAPGAVAPQRVLTGTTDRHGRWHARLVAGPTRVVAAAFGGNQHYIGAESGGGRIVVKSKASFRTSRKRVPEGKSLSFHGRIAHRGAQIPGAGKLVELQVRQGAHKWNTVEQAIHSDAHGRYKLRYKFGHFYNSDVRYLFRVKVDHEQNWPYHAPVRSRARRVTVLAR